MNPFSIYYGVLNQYWNFRGRASRSEYWSFVLVSGLVYSIVAGLDHHYALRNVLEMLYGLAIALPAAGVTVRRFHDVNRSGLWYFISLVPVIGWIILFYLLAYPGNGSENRYGLNPAGEHSHIKDKDVDVIVVIVFFTIYILHSASKLGAITGERAVGSSGLFCLGYLLIRIAFAALIKYLVRPRIESGELIKVLTIGRNRLLLLWGLFLLCIFVSVIVAMDMNSSVIPTVVGLLFVFILFPFWVCHFAASVLKLRVNKP